MISRLEPRVVDLAFFVIANLVNLLMVVLFLARVKGFAQLESALGLVVVFMIIPLGLGIAGNVVHEREWWSVVLPLCLVLFLIVELLFDYILRLNFRQTSLVWPYIAVYYLGLMAMIGYAFLIGRLFGFITLATYFLNLWATWYAHTR
jgi:hypothetical protein